MTETPRNKVFYARYDLLKVKLHGGEAIRGWFLREDKTHIVLAKSGKGNQGAEPIYVAKEEIRWQRNMTSKRPERHSSD